MLPLFPGVVLTGCNRYFFNILCDLIQKSSQKAKLGRFVLRDMRVFFNTINHQLDLIRAAGVDAGTEQRETEHEIVLTIRIPKSSCVR